MFGKPKKIQAGTRIIPGNVVEPKVDGFRVRIATCIGSNAGLVGAAIGRKRDYTHHVMELRFPPGCTFDTEVVVNGSLQETSKVLSRNHVIPYETIQVYVFDVLEVYGQDMSLKPYSERRRFLENLEWPLKNVQPIQATRISDSPLIEDLAQSYIDDGWEGVVIKRENQPYGSQWFKYKRHEAEDFWVHGIDEGYGFWSSTAGSLRLWDPRKQHLVGNCSTGSDDNRAWFTKYAGHYLNQELPSWKAYPLIVEVEYQQRTAAGQLRHPRLLRVRHDLMEINSDLIGVDHDI